MNFPKNVHRKNTLRSRNCATQKASAFRPWNIPLITTLSNFQATAKTAILFIQPQYNVTTLSPGMRCTEDSWNTHFNAQSVTYMELSHFHSYILHSYNLLLRCDSAPECFYILVPPDGKRPLCLFDPPLLCVCRRRGDVLPLRLEGLRHHRLLLLYRHHPPCGGAGVSPGRKHQSHTISGSRHTLCGIFKRRKRQRISEILQLPALIRVLLKELLD